MTWKLFSRTLIVGGKGAVPYFSGEGVDYGALQPGFSSKFTRSLWDYDKSLYSEPQYPPLSNGQWAVWYRAGALNGESPQPLQALTLAALPHSVSLLPR